MPRRSFVVIFLIVAILAVGTTAVIATHSFSDVSNSAFYHSAVAWLVDKGVTSGCGGGKYCPNDPVTRGQMALFLQRSAPIVTVLEVFTGEVNDATIGSFEELDVIGNFTKVYSGTSIKITWNSLVNTTGTEGTNFCDYQIRVDDTAPGTRDFGHVINYGGEAPASATAIFHDLAVGSRQISIWVRGNATSCGMNNGNFENTAIVEELAYQNF